MLVCNACAGSVLTTVCMCVGLSGTESAAFDGSEQLVVIYSKS